MFKPIFPVVDYVVNYEYIAKELCENKLKPQLKCNGTCQLKKELAQTSENEKPLSSDKKTVHTETEWFYVQATEPLVPKQTFFHYKKLIGDNYSNFYFHLNSCAIFHPPVFIV